MSFVRLAGVTYLDPDRVYHSYVLFTGADSVTRLIDLTGTVVHEWPYAGVPPRILDPALNGGRLGDVGVQLSDSGDALGGIYANGTIGQLSWDGERVWEWGGQAPGGAARQNHDWELLPNGNWLILVTAPRVVPGLGDHVVGDQGLYEVAPDGEIVWSWLAGDHLDEFGFSADGWAALRATVDRDPEDPWGYLEMNSAKSLGPNRWHVEQADSVFHPDNILVSLRKANIVALIDKSSGAVNWKLGPYFDDPAGAQHQRINAHKVPRPLDQICGQHNPHLIAPGLPGAGNILVFDNQGGAGYPPAGIGIYAGSRVLEIDPSTQEIVWQYTAEDSGLPSWTFFSSFVSNAQRLPNGNTLITEGMAGRIFQVTAGGDVVWEYHSPYAGYGVAGEPEVKQPRVAGVDRLTLTSLVYRSQAVPFEWTPAGTPRTSLRSVDLRPSPPE
ncbi:aryl-sulfate sulfotransferase [Mycolicibacterium elephantis]|uniref:ArsR family transcriptional regulator n=1 Tax=Mycolicibacterium elephantis DSM 44368 TaxID=1335622 RepID=A0A439DWN2_9MYCO|nr:aryl-sulfate sulfotransferase [Mycolicibacterium elephantis]MCV7223928.1 aryl-sulfate sulfotransferase [Mycolicibacterium elephantis]RWA21539.1 ArsR family transcriptional regulator [Mycolicibacterium elephantis DSM 44368]